MSLKVVFEDSELPKLKELLLRALNTWVPTAAPKWAYDLDKAVDDRLVKIQEQSHGQYGRS